MDRVILVRFGEIFLKGKNKHIFEKLLIHNILESLSEFRVKLIKISGRYVLTDYDCDCENQIVDCVTKVFGVHSVSPCEKLESTRENIEKFVASINLDCETFKVEVKRADKRFPVNSTEYGAYLGGIILDNFPNLKVRLKNPEQIVYVEIREDGNTYIFNKIIKAVGGMPVGSSGGGLLLLSGGIDSPVAGYMMAKRGMMLHAIHFHSFPYTSELAKQKVLTLAKLVSVYAGNIVVHVVPFTKIQEEIHKNCDGDFMITLMRRFMMRISETIAKQNNLSAIITGESLAQVASQTIESITITNGVINSMPVLRPLIGMDKEDITEISKKINTFETSILPYEDCCTVFLPKHPVIKPKLEKVLKEENRLQIDLLIDNALKNVEIFNTKDIK